jgi:hypothetical protein
VSVIQSIEGGCHLLMEPDVVRCTRDVLVHGPPILAGRSSQGVVPGGMARDWRAHCVAPYVAPIGRNCR